MRVPVKCILVAACLCVLNFGYGQRFGPPSGVKPYFEFMLGLGGLGVAPLEGGLYGGAVFSNGLSLGTGVEAGSHGRYDDYFMLPIQIGYQIPDEWLAVRATYGLAYNAYSYYATNTDYNEVGGYFGADIYGRFRVTRKGLRLSVALGYGVLDLTRSAGIFACGPTGCRERAERGVQHNPRIRVGIGW